MRDTSARVRTTVASVLRLPVAALDERSSPDTIASWDSLNHLQLVLALEEEFGCRFAVDDIEAMQSVGGIVAIVTQYQRGRD